MSKNLFLCGHTGSDNRGCEAIVRSTIKIFTQAGYKDKPYLATYNPRQDENAGVNKVAQLIAYRSYDSKLSRMFYAGMRKLLKNPLIGQSVIHKDIWQRIDSSDLSLSIGGDTYCYNVPTGFVAHNAKMKKLGVPSVLWCCSVGEDFITDKVKKDLENYTLIVAREAYTYENLLKAEISKDKILKCCDPAFRLDVKECELPEGFVAGNTVGIKFSGFVKNEKSMEAAEYMVENILSKTDMSICFIPHVYTVEPDTDDLLLMREFYEKYSQSGRVSVVDKALSCEEIKYIISNCRFFVGARTHTTIAAYSTSVPTLTVGYSIKSRGIAKDLFGTDEGYVVPYTDIEKKDALWLPFSAIIENEEQIKARYKEILPEYSKSVQDTAELILKKFLG